MEKRKKKTYFLCLRSVHGDVGFGTEGVVGSGGRLTGVYLFFVLRWVLFFAVAGSSVVAFNFPLLRQIGDFRNVGDW